MLSYKGLIDQVLLYGEKHDDRTKVGTTSLFGASWFHDMRNGFPLLTTKKVHFNSVVTELLWFLSGSTDASILKKQGCTIWDEWSTLEKCAKFGREEGDLGPVYGFQWRRFGTTYTPLHLVQPSQMFPKMNSGFDQIRWVLNEMIDNPNSRRLIVSAWNPQQQLEVELPPCHSFFQFKCGQNNTLSLSVYMRSCDIFLGLPFNIASYALLLEMFCRVVGRTAYRLHFSFGDLHLYDNHHQQVVTQLNRDCRPLPHVLIRSESVCDQVNPLDKLLGIRKEEIFLMNYDPHPAIKAPVAI